MLEKRNQRGRGAHQLDRRDVHEVDVGRIHERELAALPDVLRPEELAVGVHRRVRLRDLVVVLHVGRQELNLLPVHVAALDAAVGVSRKPRSFYA